MKKIYCPHDRLFKSSMSDLSFAKNFLQRHLPAKIKDLIDFNSLSLCKNTYVNNNLKEANSDVLFTATVLGKTAYIYVLCEHVRHEVARWKCPEFNWVRRHLSLLSHPQCRLSNRSVLSEDESLLKVSSWSRNRGKAKLIAGKLG